MHQINLLMKSTILLKVRNASANQTSTYIYYYLTRKTLLIHIFIYLFIFVIFDLVYRLLKSKSWDMQIEFIFSSEDGSICFQLLIYTSHPHPQDVGSIPALILWSTYDKSLVLVEAYRLWMYSFENDLHYRE